MEFVLIAVAIVVVALIIGASLLVGRGKKTTRLDDDALGGTTLTRPRPPQPTAPPVEQPDAVVPDAAAEPVAPPTELPPAEPEPGLTFETPPPSAGRHGAAALAAGPLAVLARPRPAHRPGPREADRGRLGGGRGDAPGRRRRGRRHHPDRGAAAHPVAGAGHRVGHRSARAAGPRAGRRPRAGPRPHPGHRPARTGTPASSSSSASTGPARPPPSARSRASSSATAAASCSAPPTPSARRPPTSSRRGASGSAS